QNTVKSGTTILIFLFMPVFRFFWPQAEQNADEKYEKPASGTFGNLEDMRWGGKLPGWRQSRRFWQAEPLARPRSWPALLGLFRRNLSALPNLDPFLKVVVIAVPMALA